MAAPHKPRRLENCTLAVHIRRGDVKDDTTWFSNGTGRVTDSHRYVSNERYLEAITSALRVIEPKPHRPVVCVFSEGLKGNFAAFKDDRYRLSLHLNERITTTFHHLVTAPNMIITLASAFGRTAAILSRGRVFFVPDESDWAKHHAFRLSNWKPAATSKKTRKGAQHGPPGGGY